MQQIISCDKLQSFIFFLKQNNSNMDESNGLKEVKKTAHIFCTHQQLVHAGLAFFQVDSLYGNALLSGGAEGCLHHSCGPAACNHSHVGQEPTGINVTHTQLEDFKIQRHSVALVLR